MLVIGLFAWMNWKTKADIRNQVNAQFKESVQSLVDDKLAQTDNLLAEGKQKSASQFAVINTMILELSAKTAAFDGRDKDESEREASRREPADLNGKMVLWVDDFPNNNDYPRKILEQAGVHFEIALSTEGAELALQKTNYDLIISDMGRGDNRTAGLDLLEKVTKSNPKLPVIIFASPRALAAYAGEAKRLGATSVTSEVTSLLRDVQTILRK